MSEFFCRGATEIAVFGDGPAFVGQFHDVSDAAVQAVWSHRLWGSRVVVETVRSDVAASADEPAEEFAVRVRGLTKEFGSTRAVSNVNIDVPYGEIVGIIGPSGCGKTTTVRLMIGAHEPTEGTVELWGRPVQEVSPQQKARLGYLPQLPALMPDLSIRENIHFQASLLGVPLRRKQRIARMLELVGLQGQDRTKIAHASGGMRRRAALAAALVHDPTLVFLDEPTAGIDPVLRQQLWQHFDDLRDDDKTLVITTQYIAEAIHCDRVAVIDEGALIAFDTPKGLRHDIYGGDVVQVRFDSWVPLDVVGRIGELPFVRSAPTIPTSRSLEVVVDDAGPAIVAIAKLLDDQGHAVLAVEEKIIDFDAMFVDLIERQRIIAP